MYKHKKIIFIAILIAFLCCNSAFADDFDTFKVPIVENILSGSPVPAKVSTSKDFQNKSIRVLISDKGIFDQKEFVFSSEGELFVISNNNLVASSTSPIKISVEGDNFLISAQGAIKKIPYTEKLEVSSNNGIVKIENIKKVGKIASYKGNLEVFVSKNQKLRAINIIDIEDYIKGVVPNEMPVYFGLEALKAQAISARGYAYRDASFKVTGYDVCDTTGSQVYNGANSYDPVSNRAVDETLGQFALYDGKIILSLYSSTSGGHTENYENVFSLNGTNTKFPANPIPYLKGVPDYNYDVDLTKEKDAIRFYEAKPESFENASPKYRWEYTWNKDDLTNILITNLMKFSSSVFVKPALKNPDDFGELKDIDIPKRGVSGKAMYARITTTKGTFLIAKEIMIRQIFKYNNQWLPSGNVVFERIMDGRTLVGFRAYGGGFGHGVGLSQFGASGMAKKGYNYSQILKHYYTGIAIGSYPVECNLKDLKNCKSTFYAPNKDGVLILQYAEKPHNITFKVNGEEVLITTNNFDKKTGQISLKKWLKKGINTVEVSGYDTGILNFANPKIKFYVELDNADEK